MARCQWRGAIGFLIAPDGSVLAVTNSGGNVFISGAAIETISFEEEGETYNIKFWVLIDVEGRKYICSPVYSSDYYSYLQEDGEYNEFSESRLPLVWEKCDGAISLYNQFLNEDDMYREFRQFELVEFLIENTSIPRVAFKQLNCWQYSNRTLEVFDNGVSCNNGKLQFTDYAFLTAENQSYLDCEYQELVDAVPDNQMSVYIDMRPDKGGISHYVLYNCYVVVWFYGVPASVFPWMNNA